MDSPLGSPGLPEPKFKAVHRQTVRRHRSPQDTKQKKKGKGNWPWLKARRGLRRNMFRG